MDTMSSSEPSQGPDTWISSFCNLLGHEYFAEVSEDFIEDDFNLTGLTSQVPMYKEALEMVLDVEPEEDDEEEEEEEDDDDDEDLPILGDSGQLIYRKAGDRRHVRHTSDISVIEGSAELLYGLIHQRYITSRAGIQQMYEKYEMGHFGSCPRVYCNGCRVLPVGISDIPGQETVKLFCPSCLDIYTPPNSRFQTVDGAFFGTTFGCLFLMTFPDVEVGIKHTEPTSRSGRSLENGPSTSQDGPNSINGVLTYNMAPSLGRGHIYEPRIYGFRISDRSKTGPRMRWLRSKPDDVTELDECTSFHEEYEFQKQSAGRDNPAAEPVEHAAPRKKAPLRRSRRNNGTDPDHAMDTNGINGVG